MKRHVDLSQTFDAKTISERLNTCDAQMDGKWQTGSNDDTCSFTGKFEFRMSKLAMAYHALKKQFGHQLCMSWTWSDQTCTFSVWNNAKRQLAAPAIDTSLILVPIERLEPVIKKHENKTVEVGDIMQMANIAAVIRLVRGSRTPRDLKVELDLRNDPLVVTTSGWDTLDLNNLWILMQTFPFLITDIVISSSASTQMVVEYRSQKQPVKAGWWSIGMNMMTPRDMDTQAPVDKRARFETTIQVEMKDKTT